MLLGSIVYLRFFKSINWILVGLIMMLLKHNETRWRCRLVELAIIWAAGKIINYNVFDIINILSFEFLHSICLRNSRVSWRFNEISVQILRKRLFKFCYVHLWNRMRSCQLGGFTLSQMTVVIPRKAYSILRCLNNMQVPVI
jgi:hypothetical protein